MGRDILYKTICTPVVQTTIQFDKTQTKSWEVVTLFHAISHRRATIDKILMSSILCHQRYKQDSSYGAVDIPVSAILSYWVTGVNFGYLSPTFFLCNTKHMTVINWSGHFHMTQKSCQIMQFIIIHFVHFISNYLYLYIIMLNHLSRHCIIHFFPHFIQQWQRP